MAKKNTPYTQVYTIDEIDFKKKGKINKQSLAEAHVNEHVKVGSVHQDDGLSELAYRRLNDNPFLYNYKKDVFKVTSIEDFYIPTKRKTTAQLGSVLRDLNIKRGKRKSYIVKAFSNWKKDFTKRQEQTFKKEDSKISVVGEVVPPKVTMANFFLLSLVFFIVSFFTFRPGAVWTQWADKPWFEKIETGVNNAFAESWMLMAASLTLVMVIVALIYGTIHNASIQEFRRITSGSKALYKQYCFDIKKDFKKKFKASRNYYVKAASKKDPFKIAPLPISKTGQGNIDFAEIEQMTDMYITKSADIKRSKKRLGLLKFITVYLAYLGGIGVFGYTVYSIVTSFF